MKTCSLLSLEVPIPLKHTRHRGAVSLCEGVLTHSVLPLVSVYRLLVGIPTIGQIRGVFFEWAGLYAVQLIIASYAGSTAENGKPQTTMKHNYVFYCHFYVF